MAEQYERRSGSLGKYLNRGFIIIMTLTACAMFIFWFTEPHNVGPFEKVALAAIPAWFTLNAVERWAVDRVKAQNGNDCD
jgi:hypothetical protein